MPARLTLVGIALAAAAGGTALALTSGDGTSAAAPAPTTTETRTDDRASRDLLRTALPTSSASATPTPSATTAPPTTAPKRTTTKTTAPKISIPSSCSAYSGNQAVACALLPSFGYAIDQMPALVQLWAKESGWSTTAANSSGAYGIPQALPGSKMAAVAGDWRTNPATQITWGLGYIKGRYGSPDQAWAFWQSHRWY
jgi:transglycosylase-like protein with SLT domain